MNTDDPKPKTAAVCEDCGKVTSVYIRADGTLRPIGLSSNPDDGGDCREHDLTVLNPAAGGDDTPFGGNENPA